MNAKTISSLSLAVLGLSAGALPAPAQNPRPQATPGDSAKTRVWAEFGPDIEFRGPLAFVSYGPRRLTLDLYRPANDSGKKLPVIIAIHGGGWQNGRPQDFNALALGLARKGFLVICPQYRLSNEAPFPAAVHDCKAAVRWVRGPGKNFGADPDRVAVLGGSAGGHLAAFLATTNGLPEFEGAEGDASVIQAAVVMCGPVDFESDFIVEQSRGPASPYRLFLQGKAFEEAPDLYRLASPITHFGKHMPPALFIDGENDRPHTRYTKLFAAMDREAIPREYRIMEGGPHPFWVYEKWHAETIEIVAAFLAKHL